MIEGWAILHILQNSDFYARLCRLTDTENTMSSQTKAVAQLNERLEFVNLTPADKRSLAALAPTINASLDGALNTFYAKAQKQPETAMFFKDGAHVAHAKARQARHWETIASAQFDADYVSAVSAVGRVHARLGLEPRWYIGGYALMLEGIIRAVVAGELKGLLFKGKARKLASDVSVIVKAAMIDMDYAISVYLEALAEQRTQVEIERAAIRAEQDAAMSALGEALARLSAGDLTASLDAPLADAFAKLQGDFNKAVASLGETISLVSQSVENVSSQSHEIAESTDEMAKRTEQQATALEETAAALEQIGALSKQAKARTTEINDIIVKSAEEASKSEEVVEQAINAMSDIEASSQRMTQIIGTIDEIAFQTNLLALNAGVEAARAGDQGKGFAVVAQEVRQLAQRSATAAKEIKVLIGKSSDDVGRGVVLVNTTGRALRNIGEQVQTISAFMTQITNSSHEQASGIAEINAAVSSLDHITQQNAAMAEESSASTQKLFGESVKLAKLVGEFQLKHNGLSQMGKAHLNVVSSPLGFVPRETNRRVSGSADLARKGWEE